MVTSSKVTCWKYGPQHGGSEVVDVVTHTYNSSTQAGECFEFKVS